MNKKLLLTTYLTSFFITSLLSIFGLYILWDARVGARYIARDVYDKAFVPIWKISSTEKEVREMVEVLRSSTEAKAVFGNVSSQREKHLGLMRFVMNRYAKVGPSGQSRPYDIFSLSARSDYPGVLCSDLAVLLAELAAVTGSRARVMSFQRGYGERYDCHTATELWEEGNWVLYDPTFNLTFRNAEGELLDSMGLRALTRQSKPVHYEFHGEVAFPARVEKYYIPYPLLLGVVSVFEPPSSFFAKLPPLRYFFGPRRIVLSTPEDKEQVMDASKMQQGVYRLFVLILPILCLLELLAIVSLWLARQKEKNIWNNRCNNARIVKIRGCPFHGAIRKN